MAEGFVVAEQDEISPTPTAFWDGAILQEDLQTAVLFATRQDARLVSGQLQAAYPERELTVVPARTTVQLATPARAAAVPPAARAATPG